MNVSKQYVILNADWFNKDNKNRKIIKIGVEGLNLYLNLFRFNIPNQNNSYIFLTSIGLLRKELGKSTDEIAELLKLLRFHKVIKITNLSRWEYLLDENGKIDSNRLLVIEATDVPKTVSLDYDDLDDKPQENWITIDVDFLLNYYPTVDLNKRYFPIYCLLRMLSNGHLERKSYMTIQHMADVLGYNKDTLNGMIHSMNDAKVLHSIKKDNNKSGKMFEHYLCYGHKYLNEFHNVFFSKKRENK